MSEFFQNVWSLLTTENENLIRFLSLFFVFIEITVATLLITTILKIKYTKKQILLFIIPFACFSIVTGLFLPGYSSFINIILLPILIKLVFKVTIIKAIIAQIITYLIFIVTGMTVLNIYTIFIDLPSQSIVKIPLYKITISIIQYLLAYLLYYYAKKNDINITLLDNMNKKSNIILLMNFTIGTLAIGLQAFLITSFNDSIPYIISIASLAILIVYFFANLYSLSRTTKLEKTEQDLEEEKAYNKTITVMYDNIRAFRHDFNNIVQAIGRFYCHRRYQRS